VTLSAPLLALTAALCFSLARVFLKRGLVSSTPLTAAVTGVAFTAVFVTVLAALTAPLSRLATWQILPFVAAGFLAPGMARLLVYVGVDRVGAARASSLSCTAPLFAIVLAVAFLGERPSWLVVAGAAFVVLGGVLLAQQGRAERTWRRRDMLFPLAGALGFAGRDTISRWALGSFPYPTVAAVAATLTSVVILAAFSARRSGDVHADARGMLFLALSGFLEALASLAVWGALAAGNVSIVSPLFNAQPVFTVLLTALLLRDLERVTWRIAVAAVIIVAGVVIVIGAGIG
jgi:drug/metabolite transporter (DMT)-like permease